MTSTGDRTLYITSTLCTTTTSWEGLRGAGGGWWAVCTAIYCLLLLSRSIFQELVDTIMIGQAAEMNIDVLG